MGLTRLTVARAGARRGLLAALVATVALVVAAIVLVIGSLTHAMRAIVMDALAAAETSERAAVLRIPVTDPAQFDLAADLLATRLGPAVIVTPPTRDLDVTAEWTLELDPARIDPWAIPALADDLAFLDRDVRAVDGLAPQGASVAGGLGALLKSTVPSVLAVIAIAPVPVVLIVVAGVIAVLQLARLLAASRAREQATLRARGLSRRQTWRASLAELTVVTATGALVGTAVGVATATTSSGDVTAASAAEVIRTTWPVPALAIVVPPS